MPPCRRVPRAARLPRAAAPHHYAVRRRLLQAPAFLVPALLLSSDGTTRLPAPASLLLVYASTGSILTCTSSSRMEDWRHGARGCPTRLHFHALRTYGFNTLQNSTPSTVDAATTRAQVAGYTRAEQSPLYGLLLPRYAILTPARTGRRASRVNNNRSVALLAGVVRRISTFIFISYINGRASYQPSRLFASAPSARWAGGIPSCRARDAPSLPLMSHATPLLIKRAAATPHAGAIVGRLAARTPGTIISYSALPLILALFCPLPSGDATASINGRKDDAISGRRAELLRAYAPYGSPFRAGHLPTLLLPLSVANILYLCRKQNAPFASSAPRCSPSLPALLRTQRRTKGCSSVILCAARRLSPRSLSLPAPGAQLLHFTAVHLRVASAIAFWVRHKRGSKRNHGEQDGSFINPSVILDNAHAHRQQGSARRRAKRVLARKKKKSVVSYALRYTRTHLRTHTTTLHAGGFRARREEKKKKKKHIL